MFDIEKTFKTCLSGSKEITAESVSRAIEQPFAVWCKFFAPPEMCDPIGEYEKLLFKLGQEHEARFVKKTYPEAQEIKYETNEEGFKMSLQMMADGVDTLTNVPLFYLPDGIFGVADVIERVNEGKSIFGNYHYIPKEVKLATNIKEKHLMQATFYTLLLGKIQNYIPEHFHIVNGKMEITDYMFSDYKQRLDGAIQTFRNIRDGKLKPTPTYNGCSWPWESYANKEAQRTMDMSLICGLGAKTKDKIECIGLYTVDDIYTATDDKLLGVKGIGNKVLKTFKMSAEAIKTGKHIVFDSTALQIPHAKTELFLDLEGTMKTTVGDGENSIDVEPIDYLIGILERENGKETFIPFVAHTIEEEPVMWNKFLQWISGKDDFVLYHWHHYERIHFKELVARHGCPPDLWARIESSMVDLLPITKKCVMFPTYGYSLKQIAPYCGFKWRQKDVTATESIAMYMAYTRTKDSELLDKILKYNEDDVIATRVVKDWLTSLR